MGAGGRRSNRGRHPSVAVRAARTEDSRTDARRAPVPVTAAHYGKPDRLPAVLRCLWLLLLGSSVVAVHPWRRSPGGGAVAVAAGSWDRTCLRGRTRPSCSLRVWATRERGDDPDSAGLRRLRSAGWRRAVALGVRCHP